MKRVLLALVTLGLGINARCVDVQASSDGKLQYPIRFFSFNVRPGSGILITTNADGSIVIVGTAAAAGDAGGTNARQWGTLNLTNWSALTTNMLLNTNNNTVFSGDLSVLGDFYTFSDAFFSGGLLVGTNSFVARFHVVGDNSISHVFRVGTTNLDSTFSVDTNGRAAVIAGNSTSNAVVGGNVFTSTSFANYTNCCGVITTLTNLSGVVIPAHMLTNTGDSIEFEFAGTIKRLQAATNQLQVKYGSTVILDSGQQLASNGTWRIEGTVTRAGNSAQHVQATLNWDVGSVAWKTTNSVMFIAENNGVANTLQLLGGSRTVATITNNFTRVEWKPTYRP